MKKALIYIYIIVLLAAAQNVFADDEVENSAVLQNTEAAENIDNNENTGQAEEWEDAFLAAADSLESILDPENNEVENQIQGVLDKYADSAIVRFLEKIIEVIERFLESILRLASEAAKVGVD